jgi:hypothetical protein
MQKTRSWQESFDRLEAARRAERPRVLSEAQQIREAEQAYARAAALRSEEPLMLARTAADEAEPLVSPAPKAKVARAKPKKAKSAPRKRPAARRSVAKAKPKAAKPRKKALAAAPPPPEAAITPEQLLITAPTSPLPRNASLAPWRKAGLFGLIGSWLRIAARQTTTGFAAGIRRKKRGATGPVPLDEVAELRAENEQLRKQLQALLALQRQGSKAH